MTEIGKLRYHPSYRIGTEKYNGYLTDLFTGLHYDNMVPFEDDLEKEAAYGERLWHSRAEATPDELLCTAVIGRAVVDLMELYCAGGSRRRWMLDPNVKEIVRFLELFDDSGAVLNTLKYLLNKTRDPEWVLEVVKRSHGRFLAGIGKNK